MDLINPREVVWVVSLEIFLMMLGVGMLNPVLPLYAQTFGIGTALVGLLVTTFALARLVVSVPAGIAVDRWGRRSLVVMGPLLVVASSLVCALASSFVLVLIGRFIQGMGSALFHTVGLAIIADVSKGGERARNMSFYQGAVQLGYTLGPALGGLTAAAWGYRSPFLVYAGVAAVAAAWAWARIPETRPAGGTSGPAPAPALSLTLRWFSLPVALAALVNLGAFFTRGGGQNTLLPLFGEGTLGLEVQEIGLAFALMGLTTVAGLYLGPWLVRYGGLARSILIGGLGTGGALALAPRVSATWPYVAVCSGVGLFAALLGALPAAYVAEVSPPHHYGASLGWYRSAGDLGLLTGPVATGWAADALGMAPAFWLNALLVILCVSVFAALGRTAGRGKGRYAGVQP